MATIREAMRQEHENSAAHHSAMAASHAKLAECFGKAEGMKDCEAAHSEMAKIHTAAADHHLSMCKAITAELSKSMPDSVRGVATVDAPANAFAGVRAVPRVGQPDFSKSALEAIPVEFRHLAAVEDEY